MRLPMNGETYFIDINGDIYESFGRELPDALYHAIQSHEKLDKDFSEFIFVTCKEDSSFLFKIYSPAYLCAFNFISIDVLYKLVVRSAISDSDEEIVTS